MHIRMRMRNIYLANGDIGDLHGATFFDEGYPPRKRIAANDHLAHAEQLVGTDRIRRVTQASVALHPRAAVDIFRRGLDHIEPGIKASIFASKATKGSSVCPASPVKLPPESLPPLSYALSLLEFADAHKAPSSAEIILGRITPALLNAQCLLVPHGCFRQLRPSGNSN